MSLKNRLARIPPYLLESLLKKRRKDRRFQPYAIFQDEEQIYAAEIKVYCKSDLGLVQSTKSCQAYALQIISTLHWICLKRPLSRFRYEKVTKNIDPFSVLQICRIHKNKYRIPAYPPLQGSKRGSDYPSPNNREGRAIPKILQNSLTERHQTIHPNGRFPWSLAIAAHRLTHQFISLKGLGRTPP